MSAYKAVLKKYSEQKIRNNIEGKNTQAISVLYGITFCIKSQTEMSLLFFPFLFHSAKSCYWVAHSYSTQFFLAQPNNLYKLVPHRQMLDRETWRQRFAISSYHRTYRCFHNHEFDNREKWIAFRLFKNCIPSSQRKARTSANCVNEYCTLFMNVFFEFAKTTLSGNWKNAINKSVIACGQ